MATRFDRVLATDASARQLASLPTHARITRICERVERSALRRDSVDAVVAAQAAHWFDLTLWYDEVRRVARPHAVIALVSYGIPDIDDDIDPIVSRFQQGTLRPHWPPERLHVDAGYRTLPFPFESVAVPDLDIRLDWSVQRFLGYVGTWSAVRALERAGRAAEFERIRRRLETAWGPDERSVRWPLAIVAGRV